MIDHRLLEFRRIDHGNPGIGIRETTKNGRIHQMDPVRIDDVGDPVPLSVVEMILLLEPPAQVYRGKMTFHISVGQPNRTGML